MPLILATRLLSRLNCVCMKLITDFLTKYYAACVEYACVNSGIRNLLTALNV